MTQRNQPLSNRQALWTLASERFAELPLYCEGSGVLDTVSSDEWRDWSDLGTTPDQRRIEDYLDLLDLRGRTILHVGVGSSSLAKRLHRRAQAIFGTSVAPAEVRRANSLGLTNYTAVLHNKYSRQAEEVPGSFDFIIDNNPTSFCCCVTHLANMLEFYADRLGETGQLVTDRVGLGWSDLPGANPRWSFSFEDWQAVAATVGLKAFRINRDTFVLSKRPPPHAMPGRRVIQLGRKALRLPGRAWGLSGRAARRLRRIVVSDSLLVLCYHAIADLADDPVVAEYSVPPREFERQIDSLLERGFTFVRGNDLENFLAGTARLPRRAVMLTFDDCYGELVDVAREVLARRGIPALAFAVAGLAPGSNEWDQPKGARRLALLNAEELRELPSVGVEVGCHSMTHAELPRVSPERLVAETAGAADALVALGLERPRFFAYPFGLFDARSQIAVQAAGFAAAFSDRCRRATPSSDRYAIPRVPILAAHTGWRFWLKTTFPLLSTKLDGGPLPARLKRRLSVLANR